MTLIKRHTADRMTRSALVLDLGDLKRQGECILERARAESDRILQDAEEQARALVSSADERGYQVGYERGLAEGRTAGFREGEDQAKADGRKQCEDLDSQWRAALAQFERDRAAMMHAARQEVLAFALAIGRKIVHRLPTIDPSVVQDQIAAALSLVSRPTRLLVNVHPDDVALVNEVLPALASEMGRCEHVTIAEDAAIQRGGCHIDTDHGQIDATIDTQIERIVNALLPQDRPVKTPGNSREAGEEGPEKS